MVKKEIPVLKMKFVPICHNIPVGWPSLLTMSSENIKKLKKYITNIIKNKKIATTIDCLKKAISRYDQ